MHLSDLLIEIILRVILFIIFTITDNASPYHRALQQEELWLYRYPKTTSFYSGWMMWVTVYTVPTIVITAFYIFRRDMEDFVQAMLGASMSLYVTGIITSAIKISVGRPRPDFLSRCFPDGASQFIDLKSTYDCPGNENDVLQGLKSFPSGHASLSFSSLGFVSLYIAGKLHVFNRGRGQGLRFMAFILPLIWALMISVSRTSDYHHHWQDVTVGSIIGLIVCYTCYRQVYPNLNKGNSHMCYRHIPPVFETAGSNKLRPHDPVSPPSHSADFIFVAKDV